MDSILNQSGQLTTFDPTITGEDYRASRSSLLVPDSKTGILNQSYDSYMNTPGRRGVLSDTVASPSVYNAINQAEWDAGADARISGQIDSVRDMSVDDMGLQGKTTSANYSYSEGTGGLNNKQATAIAAGIEGAATIAEGVIGAVKGKKAREEAVAEAERQLGNRREERDVQWQLEDRQIMSNKEQSRYDQMMQNNILRLNMFERDFAKAMQRYQDQQAAMDRFNKNSTDNEAFKMAIAQRVGSV